MFCMCIVCLGHPKAQPKMILEKQGIEPAPPGLQGILLIHYTTVASFVWIYFKGIECECCALLDIVLL